MRKPELHLVSKDCVVLDARGCKVTQDFVAEALNTALGFETLGTQLSNRMPGEGLYIGPKAAQAVIYRMASISPLIFVGSRKEMTPQQTRALVQKTLDLKG